MMSALRRCFTLQVHCVCRRCSCFTLPSWWAHWDVVSHCKYTVFVVVAVVSHCKYTVFVVVAVVSHCHHDEHIETLFHIASTLCLSSLLLFHIAIMMSTLRRCFTLQVHCVCRRCSCLTLLSWWAHWDVVSHCKYTVFVVVAVVSHCYHDEHTETLFHIASTLCLSSLQLFHIAIMMSTMCQADAVFMDFKTRREAILLLPRPTLWSACWPLVSVISAELICILYFYHHTKQKLDRKIKKHF